MPRWPACIELERPVTLLLRMVVDRASFVPFERRCGAADAARHRRPESALPAGFPGAASHRRCWRTAIYYGVRVRGRLVSAAGTHVINTREGIGVVGNVMTQLEYRGHDFAKIVTSAVTAELLTRVDDVALNVHTDNAPAVAAYQRLGYRGPLPADRAARRGGARAAGESCDPYERQCD